MESRNSNKDIIRIRVHTLSGHSRYTCTKRNVRAVHTSAVKQAPERCEARPSQLCTVYISRRPQPFGRRRGTGKYGGLDVTAVCVLAPVAHLSAKNVGLGRHTDPANKEGFTWGVYGAWLRGYGVCSKQCMRSRGYIYMCVCVCEHTQEVRSTTRARMHNALQSSAGCPSLPLSGCCHTLWSNSWLHAGQTGTAGGCH